MWVEMKVRGLALDPLSNMPIIILRDEEDKRSLPIWVGIFEANAIALELEKIATPRPMTHDLIKNILDSLDAKVAKVVVNWGDGTPYGITTTFPVTTPITHTYLTAGSFKVSEQVIDSGGTSKTAQLSCTPNNPNPAYFTISGKVTQSNTTTAIAGATVKVMKGTTVVKSLLSDASGNYNATLLKPGTYAIAVTKAGVVFGNPAPTATVGPSAAAVNVSSTTP